jgi:signal transduction histidine kinase
MAEVATSVLHNVGNVLNSVNVSANIVAEKVKESRADKLVALADLLTSHSGDIAAFLDSDPKGQRVLPYLGNLGLHFQQQRDLMLNELEHLTSHIGHIKQIVATQQNYAKVSGLVECFALSDLVEDALRILEPGFKRHQIGLLRDFGDVPLMTSDRHQILQIILNLLRNAQQAIDNGDRPERLIRVRIHRHGVDRIHLEVKDSGVGLSADNLTRIFAHGFTTKADGHGFGLHSGALAARQLGGTLRADSEGIGLGATFTLELPLSAPAATTQNVEVSHDAIEIY